MNGKRGMKTYTLQSVKEAASGNLLYDLGSSNPCSGSERVGCSRRWRLVPGGTDTHLPVDGSC